jgi:hypothetical protein
MYFGRIFLIQFFGRFKLTERLHFVRLDLKKLLKHRKNYTHQFCYHYITQIVYFIITKFRKKFFTYPFKNIANR